MDNEELNVIKSLPDYVDVNKETAAPTEPSQEPGDDTQLATEGEETTTPTEPTEGQPAEVETTPEDDATQEETYTVKVDGVEQQVTLEEMKNSYMRNADYTRKTTELAEQRKALQAKSDARDAELTRIRDLISNAEKDLLISLQDSEATRLRDALNKVDVQSLSNEDMNAYIRAEAHCKQLEAQEAAKKAKFEEFRNKYVEEQKRLDDEQFAEDQKALALEIPEFADPAKREKLNQDLSALMIEVFGDKKAREIAPSIRSKADYKLLYYAMVGKQFLATKTPEKVTPKAKPISAKNQAGAQTVSSTAKKNSDALLARIRANGNRGEASDMDVVQYLMSKGI